jgi:chemotaxis protein CheC
MSGSLGGRLDAKQLAALDFTLARGSVHASEQLTKWLEKPTIVEIDSVQPLPLSLATELLSVGEDPICFCAMEMQGVIAGELILAVDNASGFALADMVMGNQLRSTTEWTELAISAVLETTNIVGCAYLNSLSETLSRGADVVSLVPSPPSFRRDFPQCLLEFALMAQAIAMDRVMLAQSRFLVEDHPMRWNLLFVPDAESMGRLPRLLGVAFDRDSESPNVFATEPLE